MIKEVKHIKVFGVMAIFLAVVVSLISCGESIDLFDERESGVYSVYGTINVNEPRNFVRVYDTNKVPIERQTEELNVNVFLKNNTTKEVDLMTDRVLRFEDVFTHNFYSDMPIDYETEYVIIVEDDKGYRDSLSAFTPREASATVIKPDDDCDRISFFISITPVRYNAEEFIDFEIGFNYQNNFFTTNRASSVQQQDSTLLIEYQPNEVIYDGLGPSVEANCISDNIGTFYFNYRHYGTPGFGQQRSFEDGRLVSVNGKRILGLYEVRDLTIEVDTERSFFNN